MRRLTMTDDLQELDGVGPAREDTLNDEGYETYDDLAEADPESLADGINRLSEDTALDLVVQSQNMTALEEAEVEEEPEPEVEEEPEPEVEEGPEEYEVELDLDGEFEYDTFYHTVIEERCNLRRTNRAGVETYENMLDTLRRTSPDGSFTVEMTEDELNDLHNAVLEQRISYQGENLIDYMDALRTVENKVNAVREEHLF